jgi:hypothetical protein
MSSVETPTAAPTYRPLSTLALAGLIVSLFAPLAFVLNQTWFLLVCPLPALVMCLMARRQVRHSQGAMSGAGVAAAGIVLSVASGLGWVTSQVTEQYILAREASTFLEQWLAQVQNPDREGEAFLGSVKPVERQVSFHPNDTRRLRAHFPPITGTNNLPYDVFRSHDVVALLRRYPGQVTLVPLGSRSTITYVKGSYIAQFAYQLKCPITEGELLFTMKSEQVSTDRGPRREWHVVVSKDELKLPTDLTEHGRYWAVAYAGATQRFQTLMQRIHVDDQTGLEEQFFTPATRQWLPHLASFVRQGVPPKRPSKWASISPLLIRDEGDTSAVPHRWKLRYRILVSTQMPPGPDGKPLPGGQEMECEVELSNIALQDSESPWRITDYKFVTIRKKRDVEVLPIQPPTMRDPSEMMKDR